LFGLTEVQFGTSGQLVGKLMRIWGGYFLLRWIQQTAESRLLSQSDSSERFPLRSALNHRATYVPPEVLLLKAIFCWHSPCRSRKRIP
jgi:hypothetical protein